MSLYPIHVNMKDRRCLVIGGGRIAERKTLSLLAADAQVTVLSPTLTPALAELAATGDVIHISRQYCPGDTIGFFLVFCATDNSIVNSTAAVEATKGGGLSNVADESSKGDFIVPAHFTRGDLMITVSTGGKSPAFSRRLRKDLEQRYGDEYGIYLETISRIREQLPDKLKDAAAREAFWRQAMSDDIFTLLREGKVHEAEAQLLQALDATDNKL